MDFETYFLELQKKYPAIRVGEGAPSYEWTNEALDSLAAADVAEGREKLEQWTLACNEDFYGPELLSLLHYQLGEQELALMLIRRALKLAKPQYQEGYLDKILFKRMRKTRDIMQKGGRLPEDILRRFFKNIHPVESTCEEIGV